MKQKLMKLKDGLIGNQGFTLIELLTSLMIFAFFAVALLQYMITASSIHSSVNSNVTLEIKALATLGTIEEYAVDASASVIFKEDTSYKTLYIINNESYDGSSSGCPVYGFRYEIDTGELQYLTTTATVQKTTTTVNKTYYKRSKVDGLATLEEAYLKTEIVTYNSSITGSTAYSTTTEVRKFSTLAEAMGGTASGDVVATGVPVLEDEWVEVKSYESDSSVKFTAFSLTETTKEVLTSDMTEFKADFVKEEGKILQVDLTFGMANNRDSYEKVASIMLRNTPPSGDIATT